MLYTNVKANFGANNQNIINPLLLLQFPDTVEFAESMANKGKIVIVAALDGTYQRLGFGNILNLVRALNFFIIRRSNDMLSKF